MADSAVIAAEYSKLSETLADSGQWRQWPELIQRRTNRRDAEDSQSSIQTLASSLRLCGFYFLILLRAFFDAVVRMDEWACLHPSP